MKHAVKLLSLLLALLLTAALLAGCGGKQTGTSAPAETVNPAIEAASGTWTGIYTKLVGDSDENRNTDETFSLTLNPDGTGIHARDDMEFNVTWTLEGDSFRMEETFIGDPIIYVGTLKDGTLDIFNGDPADVWTYEYVYEKQ